MNKPRLIAGKLALVVLIWPLPCASPAIPPPPEDQSYNRALKAVLTLQPFLGKWQGSHSVNDPYGGTFRITESRVLKQIGASVSLVSYFSNNGETILNAITANKNGQLSFHRIGFASFRLGEIETVPIKRLGPKTIQWTISLANFHNADSKRAATPSVRTTVSIVKGEWHEVQEFLGEQSKRYSVVLKRKN